MATKLPGLIGNNSQYVELCDGDWRVVLQKQIDTAQIKQTCQLEKRIYPSRYIKRNDTNWATRPMPQAGIAAPEIWISNRPARRMFMLNHKNLIIFLLKVIKFDSEIWSFFCLIVKFDSNLTWKCDHAAATDKNGNFLGIKTYPRQRTNSGSVLCLVHTPTRLQRTIRCISIFAWKFHSFIRHRSSATNCEEGFQ